MTPSRMTPSRITPYRWIAVGALWTAVGIALGAFGAHALEERLAAEAHTATWETAVDYHVWHGLALVLFGLMRRGGAQPGTTTPGATTPAGLGGAAPGYLLGLGSLLFSGSLYALSLKAPGALLGPVTPLGGLLLLAGWIALARSALGAERASRNS